jgi:hypothetical protein
MDKLLLSCINKPLILTQHNMMLNSRREAAQSHFLVIEKNGIDALKYGHEEQSTHSGNILISLQRWKYMS